MRRHRRGFWARILAMGIVVFALAYGATNTIVIGSLLVQLYRYAYVPVYENNPAIRTTELGLCIVSAITLVLTAIWVALSMAHYLLGWKK